MVAPTSTPSRRRKLHVLALNVKRRHLNRDQRREVIKAILKLDPKQSDRQGAKVTGTSPSTAGDVRAELEKAGELSKLDTRKGADGKSRPAANVARRRPRDAADITGVATTAASVGNAAVKLMTNNNEAVRRRAIGDLTDARSVVKQLKDAAKELNKLAKEIADAATPKPASSTNSNVLDLPRRPEEVS